MQPVVTENYKKNILDTLPEGYYPVMEKFTPFRVKDTIPENLLFLSDLPAVMLVVCGVMLKNHGRLQRQTLFL